ncbi:MAG: hypothetical protein ACXIVO_13625 [Glycocaulis sp.]
MESRTRAWIIRMPEPHGDMWTIRRELYVGVDESGDDIWKAHRDYTGTLQGPNPASLYALIEKDGMEFMPERSDWRPG